MLYQGIQLINACLHFNVQQRAILLLELLFRMLKTLKSFCPRFTKQKLLVAHQLT